MNTGMYKVTGECFSRTAVDNSSTAELPAQRCAVYSVATQYVYEISIRFQALQPCQLQPGSSN
jgi:hypothetical protein